MWSLAVLAYWIRHLRHQTPSPFRLIDRRCSSESLSSYALLGYSDGSVIDVSTDTSWRSSDEARCGVSPSGKVTALAVVELPCTATWRSLSSSIALTAENSLHGRVIDFSTEAGVAGVVVQFAGASPNAYATTDANGFYFLPMPMIGFYQFRWKANLPGRRESGAQRIAATCSLETPTARHATGRSLTPIPRNRWSALSFRLH